MKTESVSFATNKFFNKTFLVGELMILFGFSLVKPCLFDKVIWNWTQYVLDCISQIVIFLLIKQHLSIVQFSGYTAYAPHVHVKATLFVSQFHFWTAIHSCAHVWVVIFRVHASGTKVNYFDFSAFWSSEKHIFRFQVTVHNAALFQMTGTLNHLADCFLQKFDTLNTQHLRLFEVLIQVASILEVKNHA